MERDGIAPHEALEVLEILSFKNVCLTKSITSLLLISDDELKTILQQDVETGRRHITELRELIGQPV